jgi:hypothetical protein
MKTMSVDLTGVFTTGLASVALCRTLASATNCTGTAAGATIQQPKLCLPLWILGSLLFLGCLGCRDTSENRLAIHGEITINGQAMPDGYIVFDPLPGTAAVRSVAPVKNGIFELSRRDGLPAGRYCVRIYDTSTDNFPWDDPEHFQQAVLKNTLPRDRIPAHYNNQSTLHVDIRENDQRVQLELTIP